MSSEDYGSIEKQVKEATPDDEPEAEGPPVEIPIEEALDNAGFSWRQLGILLVMGLAILTDHMELEVGTLLGPELLCEWDLAAIQEAWLTAAMYAGMALGGVAWGNLADRIGRKPVIQIICVLGTVFAVLSSTSAGPVEYAALRFCAGFAIGGFHVCYTYATESVGSAYRARACFLLFISHFLGLFLGSTLAVFTIPVEGVGWRVYVALSSIPIFSVFLLVTMFCPESPRYLLISGKSEEALEVIQGYNRDRNKNVFLTKVDVSKRGSLGDLFGKFSRARIILTLAAAWLLMKFQNLGITLMFFENLANPHSSDCDLFVETYDEFEEKCHTLQEHDYIMNTIYSSSFLLAAVMSVICADTIGRRWTLISFSFISASCLGLLYFCMDSYKLTAVAILTKSFSMCSLMVMVLYVNELFPTYIRSVACGVGDCFSRLGLIASPFVAQFISKTHYPTAVTVYLILGYLLVVLVQTVKEETKNEPQIDCDKVEKEFVD